MWNVPYKYNGCDQLLENSLDWLSDASNHLCTIVSDACHLSTIGYNSFELELMAANKMKI